MDRQTAPKNDREVEIMRGEYGGKNLLLMFDVAAIHSQFLQKKPPFCFLFLRYK